MGSAEAFTLRHAEPINCSNDTRGTSPGITECEQLEHVSRVPPPTIVLLTLRFPRAPVAGHLGEAEGNAPQRRLWVRATSCVVQIFREHQLVATHGRAHRPGQRVTNPVHLPPKKLRYLMLTPTCCRERAALIGPATADFITRLLGDEVLDRLRGAQATLRLAETFGEARLEGACRRAVACDAIAAKTVQRILHRGLDREPLPGEAAPASSRATRTSSSSGRPASARATWPRRSATRPAGAATTCSSCRPHGPWPNSRPVGPMAPTNGGSPASPGAPRHPGRLRPQAPPPARAGGPLRDRGRAV